MTEPSTVALTVHVTAPGQDAEHHARTLADLITAKHGHHMRLRIAITQPDEHHYLSTGCLHGEHAYCQGKTGQAGAKTPAKCKFCDAPCQCWCHQEAPERIAVTTDQPPGAPDSGTLPA